MLNRFNIWVWCVLVVFPLIPVTWLYWLFKDQNFFSLEDTAKGILATGPIAAYVGVLWIGWKMWAQLSANRGLKQAELQPLVGSWTYKSESSNGTVRNGNCEFRLESGEVIGSGDFVEGDKKVGTWETHNIWRRGDLICVVYELREIKDGHEQSVEGISRLRLQTEPSQSMSGTWAIIRTDTMSGTVEYTFAKNNQEKG